MPPLKDVISTAEAAKELKVSARRVVAMITAGQLPATQFGGSYAIRRVDLKLVKDRKPGRPKGK